MSTLLLITHYGLTTPLSTGCVNSKLNHSVLYFFLIAIANTKKELRNLKLKMKIVSNM